MRVKNTIFPLICQIVSEGAENARRPEIFRFSDSVYDGVSAISITRYLRRGTYAKKDNGRKHEDDTEQDGQAATPAIFGQKEKHCLGEEYADEEIQPQNGRDEK